MSKAFDTVQRNNLLQKLKTILDDDELHIMKILLKDVKLIVRVGKHKGDEIVTNIGVPQGDCLSPILFTLYLAQALDDRGMERDDHTYTKPNINAEDLLPESLKDHTYSTPVDNTLLIDQQYADDTGWIGVNAKHKTDKIKREIPQKLKKNNLFVNEGKTEEYHIKRGGDNSWKKCKYLGSHLDTEQDIKRRKSLAISTYNKMKNILENRKTSIPTKKRIFKCYIESVLLYNSELWTMTKKLNDEIDVFQRNQIRRALNIRWQDKMTNTELYRLIGLKPVSQIVKERRLRWFGHVNRLPDTTPARIALEEATRKVKKPRGGQKMTWPKMMENELKTANISFDFAKQNAQNRPLWRTLTHRIMSECSDGRCD